MTIENGALTKECTAAYYRIRTNSQARVYKIESIAFSEESFVEITGSYVPLTADNKMRALDWDDDDFVIEDQFDASARSRFPKFTSSQPLLMNVLPTSSRGLMALLPHFNMA